MYLARVTLAVVLVPAVVSLITTPTIPVSVNAVFSVDVHVEDAKGGVQAMIFDTGSTHSWLYDYHLLKEAHGRTFGGISETEVRTRLAIPAGGGRIGYADSDYIECDTWTHKQFRLGNHTWIHPFGIVVRRARRNTPVYSGLIGASVASYFVQENPIFAFEPHSRNSVKMTLGPLNAEESCANEKLVYRSLGQSPKMMKHWWLDVSVTYGSVRYSNGAVLDTGASVIALPATAFEYFAVELALATTNFVYIPAALHGLIDCPIDFDRLPSFEVLLFPDVPLSVTPRMYISKTYANRCIVEVARLSDGGPIILGLPLVRNFVLEFNAIKRRVGFCQPIADRFRSIEPRRPFPPDKYTDCPLCKGTAAANYSAWAVALLIFIIHSID